MGFDVGLMFNRTSKDAFGASIYLAGDDDGSRFGIRPRYRRWLTRRVALDFSAGVLFGGTDNYVKPKWPGFVASTSLAFAELISVDIHFESYRFERTVYTFPPTNSVEKGTTSSLYVGLTGRSYGAFALPLGIIIGFLIYSPSFNTGS